MAPKNRNLHGEREQRKENHMKKVLEGNESTKIMSYRKRINTLTKKARELETLCDVKVGLVCFGRDGKVRMFPDNKTELKELVKGFQRLNENAKKEMNLIEFLEEQNRKSKSKMLDQKFLKLSKHLGELADTDALEFLESKLVSFKEKLGLLASQKLTTSRETWVCDFNTCGNNIIGTGLEEPNWVCKEYNTCSQNNSGSSIDDNNNLLFNFPNQLGSFQFFPAANSFIVSNYQNLHMPQLESDSYLNEGVPVWAPTQV